MLNINTIKNIIIEAGIEYKECFQDIPKVFRGCKLIFAMGGIGKSKHLVYPIEWIKLPKSNNCKENVKLMSDNFKTNIKFVIKTVK